MKNGPDFSALLQGFFTQRLLQQKQVSPHTIASYRDTFRMLLQFAQQRLHKSPCRLALEEVDAPLIAEFLQDLEKSRRSSARTRNLRLTAIRSFFQYAAYEAPAHAAQIQRVLAIPSKRYDRRQVQFLSQPEIRALVEAPDTATWSGRRDRLLLLIAIQTGLRLSELIKLARKDVALGTGAHVRCMGKGRKERCTPLTKQAAMLLKAWTRELPAEESTKVFPNARGAQLSGDGVRYVLAKHLATAAHACPSLQKKKVTPHWLRHTMAMELLQAGVDRAVIALWMGHESVETTQIYLSANLALR
jgi:site-specific recombinase XerD